MVWTSPMTAVAFEPFSAAEFNTHVRDNLLETEAAKATNAGSYLVSTGLHTVDWRRAVNDNTQSTTSTSSTSFVTLSPDIWVQVNTGTTALVIVSAALWNSTGDVAAMSHMVTGATEISATHDWSLINEQNNTQVLQMCHAHLHTNLTPGLNTFRAQYQAPNGGTASFTRRHITVLPF